LAAIAFALSSTVRGETERASTALDGLRCYYLAAGAIERSSLELLWSVQNPDRRPIPRGSTSIEYVFPSGNVLVEFTPEAAKLDVNAVPVQQLYRLLVAIGEAPQAAQEIAAAIEDWRRPVPQGSPFDSYYLAQTPSFRPPHASIREIEELLSVKGITPDLFYGTYVRSTSAEGPRLVRREGLVDCLSVFGARDRVDANTASPAVLTAVGLSPFAVSALVNRRRAGPLSEQQLNSFVESIGAGGAPLRVEGHSIVTIRATARLRLEGGRLSDLKRTVAAQVKYMPAGYTPSIHILRWYDTAWSN
jgi:general secretion pathway protein K